MTENENDFSSSQSLLQQSSPTKQKKKSLSKLAMKKKSSSLSEELLPSPENGSLSVQVLKSDTEEETPGLDTRDSAIATISESTEQSAPTENRVTLTNVSNALDKHACFEVVENEKGKEHNDSVSGDTKCDANNKAEPSIQPVSHECVSESIKGSNVSILADARHSNTSGSIESEKYESCSDVVDKHVHSPNKSNTSLLDSGDDSPSPSGLLSKARRHRRKMLSLHNLRSDSSQSLCSRSSDELFFPDSKNVTPEDDLSITKENHSVSDNSINVDKVKEESDEVASHKSLNDTNVDNDVIIEDPKSPFQRSYNKQGTSYETCSTGTPSMDALARQSLLAARVLHIIPTYKARARYVLLIIFLSCVSCRFPDISFAILVHVWI